MSLSQKQINEIKFAITQEIVISTIVPIEYAALSGEYTLYGDLGVVSSEERTELYFTLGLLILESEGA